MEAIRLPVRKIVELILRTGDIDSRFSDSSAMYEGAKAHRKLQKSMGENYQSEVPLSLSTEMGGIPVKLYGRADGIITGDGGVIIDEIKTTNLTLEQIYEQRELHLGQAKCYAVMLLAGMDEPASEITVQLTYYQLETGETKRYLFTYSRQELDDFFEDLKRKYGVWLRFEHDWTELRNKSVKETVFPFEAYRKGQREMAVAVYRAIEKKKKLYVQAPTGIGKTLSTLFPSVKAVGEGQAEKLFYLTAKTVTRAVAEDSMRLMAEKGLRFKSLTLRAKDKICFKAERICNPDYCEYAKGHFDRVNDALLDLLYGDDLITPRVIAGYAGRHRVCPYELSLDAASWADLVIGDYNHVFDPVVYLKRFFNDTNGEYVFLIDEAHNLADRVRDMYTEAVRKSAFNKLKTELKDKTKTAVKLRRSIGRVAKSLIEAKKDCGEQKTWVSEEQNAELAAAIALFAASAEEWLASERHSAHPLQNDVMELYFEALSYMNISELYDGRYAAITEIFGSEVVYTLYCLDPSAVIGEKLGLAKASVMFSATLTPLAYYRDILGGLEDDGILSLPSPFDKSRLLLMAHYGISTKYADRPGSIAPVTEAIYLTVSKKSGNYIVYFPSYEYLKQVYEEFARKYPDIRTIIQQSKMDEDERDAFLESFAGDNSEALVGFCVMGGVFSEGIDLKGERLIGSIIVGVGLPKLSLRQDLIRDYFDAKNGAGYDFAYVFPGMNKVLQAAGRVIRTESDYGVALLIDSRFATAKYRGLYPAFWSDIKLLKDKDELNQSLENFTYFK